MEIVTESQKNISSRVKIREIEHNSPNLESCDFFGVEGIGPHQAIKPGTSNLSGDENFDEHVFIWGQYVWYFSTRDGTVPKICLGETSFIQCFAKHIPIIVWGNSWSKFESIWEPWKSMVDWICFWDAPFLAPSGVPQPQSPRKIGNKNKNRLSHKNLENSDFIFSI